LFASAPLQPKLLLCGYSAFHIASALLGVIGLLVLSWAITALQRTKRRRAWALQILDQLVGLGDPVIRAWVARQDREAVDRWRGTVGTLMVSPPFRPGLHDTVLGGQGADWITEPLRTLRDIALRFDDDWLSS